MSVAVTHKHTWAYCILWCVNSKSRRVVVCGTRRQQDHRRVKHLDRMSVHFVCTACGRCFLSRMAAHQHQVATAKGRASRSRQSPYARLMAQSAAGRRQGELRCASAHIAMVRVQQPHAGGKPAGHARVTTVVDSARTSPSDAGSPAASDARPASPAEETAGSPAAQTPSRSRCMASLCAVTQAASQWPPGHAFHLLQAFSDDAPSAWGWCTVHPPAGNTPPRVLSDMNRTERAVMRCLLDSEMSMDAGDRVLRLLQDPALHFGDVRFASTRTYRARMQAEELGVLHADLSHPGEKERIVFWYRRAWVTLRKMVQSDAHGHTIAWGFRPEYDGGDRVYSAFNSSMWLQGAYEEAGNTNTTILGVMIGSDGAKFKKKLSGHPLYLSCANFDEHHRQSPKGWSLLGFVPRLDQASLGLSDVSFARRKRQIMDACLCAVTDDLLETVRRGGESVLCTDRRSRVIVPMLSMYVTDRQEHELVLHAKALSCFHCAVPLSRKCDSAWSGQPKCAAGVRKQIVQAMTTGVYGQQQEWKSLIKDPRPIMRVNQDTGTLDVGNSARYEDCARVIGHYPEPNLFVERWREVGVDVLHICRDDPMHMVQLGLMQHLLQASVSRIIDVLSPAWACEVGKAVGPSGMMNICDRLGERIVQSAPHLKKFAADAFSRTFRQAIRAEGRGRMNWGLTGFEMEALYRASVLCWQGLIDEELQALSSDAARPARSPVLEDPTHKITYTLGLFLSWYNGMRLRRARASSVCVASTLPACNHVTCMLISVVRLQYTFVVTA